MLPPFFADTSPDLAATSALTALNRNAGNEPCILGYAPKMFFATATP